MNDVVSTPRHLVSRVSAVQQDDPSIRLTVELTADADPDVPLRPGQSVGFDLTLFPEGAGHRYYGYVMAPPFAKVAHVEQLAGMSLLASGDRYASSVEAGTTRVARFTARIHDDAGAGAFLVPEVRSGIIARGGSSLTSGTHAVKQRGFRIAPLHVPGRTLRVALGYRGLLTGLTEGLGEHVQLVGVGPARFGATYVAPDGAVTYTPFNGHTGYDRFDYVLDDGAGRLVRGRVTVCVGDMGAAPGVLAG